MADQPFDQLIDQAAAGLKGDRELYLDVKEELRTHLEDKAEQFAREGAGPEESIDKAKESFGSPLDVAADLLNANRNRMKLRALLRIAFGALIVPLAIILALYMGYGLLAPRLKTTHIAFLWSDIVFSQLPIPPSLCDNAQIDHAIELMAGPSQAESIRSYWESHRQEPDGYKYYAYYAIMLRSPSSQNQPAVDLKYVETMRLGERLEPRNALYNVLLASHYLDRGIMVRSELPKLDMEPKDYVLDWQAFELGMMELRKAVSKPYLHTYQGEILLKKLNSLPVPVFAEHYSKRITIAQSELVPHFAGYRSIAEKIPGCAQVLIAQGRTSEAKSLADTWENYTLLLMSDDPHTFFQQLVCHTVASMLSRGVDEIYDSLGYTSKAAEARATYQRLSQQLEVWKNGALPQARERYDEFMRKHGSMLAVVLTHASERVVITKDELRPGRMVEYVLSEEMSLGILLLVLVLALIGTLAQGMVWLHRLRRADAVPLLLLPSAKQSLQAMLLGIILPVAVYLAYSALPISGREFSLTGGMWVRFLVEMAILGLLMLWLPARLIRGGIRRRCTELGIALPEPRSEIAAGWAVRGAALVALGLLGATILVPADSPYLPPTLRVLAVGVAPYLPPTLRVLAVGVALAAGVAGIWYAGRNRREHGLYYGTLARSLAPVYAFSIILISLTVQPWLLYNEAKWLRKDTLIYGYLANRRSAPIGFSTLEERAARAFSKDLYEALGADEPRSPGE